MAHTPEDARETKRQIRVLEIVDLLEYIMSSGLNGKDPTPVWKHRHAKHARVIFLVIGVFVELFTVMIWLSFLGCDVQQEGNWKSIICKYNVTSVMVR